MITISKLKLYQSFNGDIDFFSRVASEREKNSISDNEWFLIDSLISDIDLIKNELASESFKTRFQEILKKNFENELTITFLYSMDL